MTALESLREAIHRHEITAFIGAGVSRRLQYPAWNELLKQLAKEIGISPQLTGDPLWDAEEMRLHYLRLDKSDADFRKVVGDIYAPTNASDPIIAELLNLPFRNVLTTNYDEVIERTNPRLRRVEWSDELTVRELITSPATTTGICLHVHGSWDKPESIVLCESDYSRRYLESLSAHRKFFALLATQRLAFFGFSLGDPAFEEVLRVAQLTLGAGTPRHYAVLPIKRTGNERADAATQTSVKQRLNRKFGIEPIFITDEPGFPEFEQTIRALSQEHVERLFEATADPNKGAFGGREESNGRRLSARVTAVGNDPDWFNIELEVAPTNGVPLTSDVTFHLHPTFDPDTCEVRAKNGVAAHSIWAWGAFTVGAEIHGENTKLELDLAQLPNAPQTFRER